jgi:uncharacterized protein (DUF927 family)
MLANGEGKGRGKADAGLRESKTWKLLALSSGEMTAEDFDLDVA